MASDEVDRLFQDLPPVYRPIARALRATIRAGAPGLVERVKWNNPFWCGRADVLCLQCYPDHVNLGVLRGAELVRDHPALEGTGRAMRHLKVRSVTEARSASVRALVRSATALDRVGSLPRRRARRPAAS